MLRRTAHRSAGSWKGTKAQGGWRGKGQELKKTVGVQECLRGGQGGVLVKQERAGAWTAQPSLQSLGSRREHQCEVQPLQLFLPTFVLFSSSSQNRYLSEQASCQDVAIQMFVPDSGCDSCSTATLGKSIPLKKWQKTQS